MSLAPIILFIYNRPEHTLRTLEALANNKLAEESALYIFADGPRKNADASAIERINETRAVVRSREWCKSMTLYESDVNKGLANSIIEGVTKIVKEQGKVIVLEDDLVTSPYFLQYMNDALDTYEGEKEVACISAYIYPAKAQLPETFFIKGADCWGWATWDRAWNVFEKDGKKLLNELNRRSLQKEFDFNGTYPYTAMLEDQIARKNDSWAIRWYAAAFLKNMMCLYPGTSLVQNIGFDGTGTHSGTSADYTVNVSAKPLQVWALPVTEDKKAKKAMMDYFRSMKPSAFNVFKLRIKKILKVLHLWGGELIEGAADL